jgi:proline iminopeptidase
MTTIDRRGLLVSGAAALAAAALSRGLEATERPAGGDALSAGGPLTPPIKTGGVRLVRVDGKYSVWTKKVGAGKARMLTLHGGPGATHEYLQCFEDFLPQAGIEFHFYDQLGSYFSDQPDDTSLWTVPRFVGEVEQVRAALGLEQYYLFGHSWGGMLGIETALAHQGHIKALIISDMTASIPSYVAYAKVLKSKMPTEIVAILDKYEATGDYQAQEYQDAVSQGLYSKHMCRLDPWPDPVTLTFKHFNQQVYNTMQGPNEFVITGNFKDWDRWADLPKITVPTLLMAGRHGTMNPADIERMGKTIPHSRVVFCENGSHLEMWDDQQAYHRELIRFVHDVESGRFRGRGGA